MLYIGLECSSGSRLGPNLKVSCLIPNVHLFIPTLSGFLQMDVDPEKPQKVRIGVHISSRSGYISPPFTFAKLAYEVTR